MPKICEVVSDVDHLSEDTIKEVIERNCIKRYAYILHDKDILEDGTPKNPHYHIVLQFKDNEAFKYVADWFGLPVNFINRIKGRFVDGLKYLTHANAKYKYQYDISEVDSNFDVSSFISNADSSAILTSFLDKISTGEIREYNYFKFIDVDFYAQNKAKIEAAFKFRRDLLSSSTDRQIDVVFIAGSSGTGKTYFAKDLCNKLDLSYSVSSSDNDCLQDYKGQDVIILDDLRDGSFKFTDLLKLLDNNTKTSVKTRSSNKLLECSLIIITSCKPLADWYRGVSDDEQRTQLERRIKYYYEVTKDFVFEYEHVSDGTNILRSTCKNPVVDFLSSKKDIFKSKLSTLSYSDFREFLSIEDITDPDYELLYDFLDVLRDIDVPFGFSHVCDFAYSLVYENRIKDEDPTFCYCVRDLPADFYN